MKEISATRQLAKFLGRYSPEVRTGGGALRPHRVLRGRGNKARHVVLEAAAVLDSRLIRALIGQALASVPKRLDPRTPRRIVIKSVSARQRPQRPRDRPVRRTG